MLTATCDHRRPSPGSCSEAVPILASLPAPCSSSVPRPFAQPGGSPPTGGLIMNPLWAHLWLLWACGHFGLASSHAVHPAPRPGHRIITGAVDTRRARAGGAPTSLLKFAGGSQPSARVPGGSYKLPAEPGPPSGLWQGRLDEAAQVRPVSPHEKRG